MFESSRNSPNPQSLEKLFHRSGPWCLKGWGPLLTHVCVLLLRLPHGYPFSTTIVEVIGSARVSFLYCFTVSMGLSTALVFFDPQHNLMGKPRRVVFSHLIYQRYVSNMP